MWEDASFFPDRRPQTLACPCSGLCFCALGGLLLPGSRAGPCGLLGLGLHLLRPQVPGARRWGWQGARCGAETALTSCLLPQGLGDPVPREKLRPGAGAWGPSGSSHRLPDPRPPPASPRLCPEPGGIGAPPGSTRAPPGTATRLPGEEERQEGCPGTLRASFTVTTAPANAATATCQASTIPGGPGRSALGSSIVGEAEAPRAVQLISGISRIQM